MSKMRMLEINGKKLEKELKRRGLNELEVSEALGYDRYYIRKLMRRGCVGGAMLKALELKYCITYEDIKPDSGVEEQQVLNLVQPQGQGAQIDYEKLEWHMRRAFAAALQDRGL